MSNIVIQELSCYFFNKDKQCKHKVVFKTIEEMFSCLLKAIPVLVHRSPIYDEHFCVFKINNEVLSIMSIESQAPQLNSTALKIFPQLVNHLYSSYNPIILDLILNFDKEGVAHCLDMLNLKISGFNRQDKFILSKAVGVAILEFTNNQILDYRVDTDITSIYFKNDRREAHTLHIDRIEKNKKVTYSYNIKDICFSLFFLYSTDEKNPLNILVGNYSPDIDKGLVYL